MACSRGVFVNGSKPKNRQAFSQVILWISSSGTAQSVNQTVDNMGFYNALQACFTLHELNHQHWAGIHENGYPVALPEDGIASWRDAPPVVRAEKDSVRAT